MPFVDADADNQWPSDDYIQPDGFLFCEKFNPNTFLVQSVRNGDLFVNKVLQPGSNTLSLNSAFFFFAF